MMCSSFLCLVAIDHAVHVISNISLHTKNLANLPLCLFLFPDHVDQSKGLL